MNLSIKLLKGWINMNIIEIILACLIGSLLYATIKQITKNKDSFMWRLDNWWYVCNNISGNILYKIGGCKKVPLFFVTDVTDVLQIKIIHL